MKSTNQVIDATFKSNKESVSDNLLHIIHEWCTPLTVNTTNREQLIILSKIISQYMASNADFRLQRNNSDKVPPFSNSNYSNYKRGFPSLTVPAHGESKGKGGAAANGRPASNPITKGFRSYKKLRIGSDNIFDSSNVDII